MRYPSLLRCDRLPRVVALGFCLVLLMGATAWSEELAGPANVLILVNDQSSDSAAVAAHYRQIRGVPEANVCHVSVADTYKIPQAEFLALVREPFKACLESAGLKEQVLFLVVTRGIPGVVTETGEVVLAKEFKAADSFLADPWDEWAGDSNGYFQSALPFTRANGFRGYLVSRLDGPSLDVALALVDRSVEAGAAPEGTQGVGYFDTEPNGDNVFDREVIKGAGEAGNGQIEAIAAQLSDAGWQVVLDTNDAQFGTAPAQLVCPDARWYFGWYAPFFYNDAFQWAPGAVGLHLESFSAQDFRKSGSWVAGALEAGITGTAGAVWEPYFDGFIRGDLFLEGFVLLKLNLAESAWRAIPKTEWMNVVFGDPLFSLAGVPPVVVEPGVEESGPEAVEEVWSDSRPESVADQPSEIPEIPSGPTDAALADSGGADASEVAPSVQGKSGGCSTTKDSGRFDCAMLLFAILVIRLWGGRRGWSRVSLSR